MKKTVKITLDPVEIKRLEVIGDINCTGIKCSECPYDVPDRDLESHSTRCFAAIVDYILTKGR